MNLQLRPGETALVLIDLEHGIVSRELAPYTGNDVVTRSAALAKTCRAAGVIVVYVHVLLGEILPLAADLPTTPPPGTPPPPPEASELVPEAGYDAKMDVLITKRQRGAFYGTGLEQQLRRRGIKTIIMGGIATNLGVESTARAAFDRGFELVFAEDAMSSVSAEMHAFSTQKIFPGMGRVRSTEEITKVLESMQR